MAYQLTALYNPPTDPQAFDAHYEQVHAPLALKLPGLRTFTVSHPAAGADGTAPSIHLVAVLTFDSADAMNSALGGPEGEAAVADLENFAGAGVTMLMGPVDTLA